jgi:hypothetical protein
MGDAVRGRSLEPGQHEHVDAAHGKNLRWSADGSIPSVFGLIWGSRVGKDRRLPRPTGFPAPSRSFNVVAMRETPAALCPL